MAGVGNTGRFFPVGEGSAARLDPSANAYRVYNPLARKNFSITGFGQIYERADLPETAGRPLHQALGAALQDQTRDGRGTELQHFHRGFLSWTNAGGFQVHLDFPIGEGWGRKLPDGAWSPLADPPTWGHLFCVFNPSRGERYPVTYGFAQFYDRTDVPATGGRPVYELLGPPCGPQQSDGADGAYQQFEYGRLTWNPRDDVQLQLGVLPDPIPAQHDLRTRLGLEGTKKISAGQLAQLGGRKQPLPTPRLRLAPSPTGYLHAGNAWIAVQNYLAAKKLGGEFLLRIEDTDPLRSRPEYTEVIKESLRWLGLEWDGEILFQSQRSELYRAKAEELIAAQKAYRDPSTGAVFFKMPERDRVLVNDRVKGAQEVSIVGPEGERDFMLLRPDGSPMFLLANTVDDGEQRITHVIRGDGHLMNAARQVCLFEALGYPVPEFYHLPHVLGEEGGKLSKREGAVSVLDFRDQGIDPELLRDHLAQLGSKKSWNETRDRDALIEGFDRFGFAKKASRIGLAELLDRSKRRIVSMDAGQLRRKLEAFAPEFMQSLDPAAAFALADAARKRASTYLEAIRIGEYVLGEPQYTQKAGAVNLTPERRALLGKLAVTLERAGSWRLQDLGATLGELHRKEQVTFSDYADTLSWALVGDTEGVPVENLMAILGRERTLARLGAVLEDRIRLVPEADEKSAPAVAEAKQQLVERPPPYPLGGAHLQLYLRHARWLGAPIGEARPDALGQSVQPFENGATGDRGQLQLFGRPYWISGGKLETYLARRELIGDATGEAHQSHPGSNQWLQRFDRALIADDGHVLLDGHAHWLTGGKLDAWVRCRDLLGPTAGEAYFSFGEWRQDFAHGQTSDAGAVRLEGTRFWIAAPILGTYLAHREALGQPVGEAYREGELWAQDFAAGRILGGEIELGAREVTPPPPDGTLVREDGQAAVFRIAGGAKLHVVDEATFARLGYAWDQVSVLPAGALRSVSEIPADGALVKQADQGEVYVIRGAKKAHIPDPAAFNAAGFDWNAIHTVPDGSLASVMTEPY